MDSVHELICAYYNDEISEEEFICTMLFNCYSPEEIRFCIDSKDEAREADLVFVTLH
jgi:hypothetical protein